MPRNAPTIILLYQAQFKKEFYIFQHTLLCQLARVKIEHYAQYDSLGQNDFDLLHVLRLACNTEVFEHVGQELEGGSLEWILLPALQHDLK